MSQVFGAGSRALLAGDVAETLARTRMTAVGTADWTETLIKAYGERAKEVAESAVQVHTLGDMTGHGAASIAHDFATRFGVDAGRGAGLLGGQIRRDMAGGLNTSGAVDYAAELVERFGVTEGSEVARAAAAIYQRGGITAIGAMNDAIRWATPVAETSTSNHAVALGVLGVAGLVGGGAALAQAR